MRKRKVSAVVAWTLTAAMVASPVNATWAEEVSEAENSQMVETFTDGDVPDETVNEVQADTEETDEDQQEDVSDENLETSDELTVPDAEENAFSDGSNSVETFSAGETDGESENYDYINKDFPTLFAANTVTRDVEKSKVTVKLQTRCDYYSNQNCYGFVITGSEKDETYINHSEAENSYFAVWVENENGFFVSEKSYGATSFAIEKNKKYYIMYITEEVLPENSVLEFTTQESNVKNVEVLDGVPQELIHEFGGNYTPVNAKVKVTYTDGTEETVAYNEVKKGLGRLICQDASSSEGCCELTFMFSENILASTMVKVPFKNLSEVKDKIPEVNLNKDKQLSSQLYNGNVFKFTAPNKGYYKFQVTGDLDKEQPRETVILKEDGSEFGGHAFHQKEEPVLLENGETIYMHAVGDIGDAVVKAEEMEVITGAGSVKNGHFVFAPQETGTYKFSCQGEEDQGYYIFVEQTDNLISMAGDIASLKCESGKGYKVRVVLDDADIDTDDVTVNIEKLPSIESISINDDGTGNSVHLSENIFTDPKPSITVKLDDGQEIDSKNMGRDYGWLEHIILGEDGKEISGSSLENGNYKYRYYYTADPSIKSPDYAVEYTSFEKYFDKNTTSQSDDKLNVTLQTGIYSTTQEGPEGEAAWYYGFVIGEEDQDVCYKIDSEDTGEYQVYVQNESGEWNYLQNEVYGYIKIKKSGKAYVLYSKGEKLPEDKTLTLTRMKNNVSHVEWEQEPSAVIIEGCPDFALVDVRLKVTYTDGNEATLTYGRLACTSLLNDDNEKKYHFFDMENPYVTKDITIPVKPLNEVAEDIPEIKLNEKEVSVPHNFSNGNIFKFTAPKKGRYNIQVSGKVLDAEYREEYAETIIVASGEEIDNSRWTWTNPSDLNDVSLEEGDTLYVGMAEYVGDVNVKITSAETPSPDPDPIVTPRPDPVVTPNPTPQPTQTPTPSPSPSPTPSPEPSQVPVVSEAKVQGNKAEVTLEEDMENVEGYDFVLCANEKDLAAKKYLVVKKNVEKPETSFSYLQKGTYYVYCHGWIKVNGKKVFTEWSKPFEITVNTKTVAAPKIKSVKVSKHKVVVKLSRDEEAAGVDVVLGTKSGKDEYGKKPEDYGKQVKKNKTGTTITFTNVPSGTYYVGAHSFIRNEDDNKKSFSKWSNLKKFSVK